MNEKTEESRWIKAGWVFLFIFVTADFFSISVAQIAALGLGVCWIGQWISSGEKPDLSPLFIPFMAFILASMISALLSLDVAESIRDSKDLLQIVIFFAAYDLFRRQISRTEALFRMVALAGGVIAVAGIGHVAMNGLHIYHRISGFQDIWMTYAGLLMLAIVLATGVAAFTFNKWRDTWIVVAIILMLAAITLSLTRNAWLGAITGVAVIAALRKPVLIALIPVLAALVFVISPDGVRDRIKSVTDPSNESNRERLLLWKAGGQIWLDNPLFGVGQNSFPLVYPKYRDPAVHEPEISHLHNNFLEIMVERGAIGLVAWISIWGVALWLMLTGWIRRGNNNVVNMTICASIGFISAFLVAGVFEYNFGDSEIQMLFYMALAAGVASARPDGYNHV